MHLLLVEDSPGDVALVQEALKGVRFSIECSVVTDGRKALAFLRRAEPYTQVALPDFVLLELNLPVTSGFEILAMMRQDPALKYIPVVVWSSTDQAKDVNRCYELGANAYIVKPLELDSYLNLVKTTVEFWSACKFRNLKS